MYETVLLSFPSIAHSERYVSSNPVLLGYDVASRHWVITYRLFEGTWCLHYQGSFQTLDPWRLSHYGYRWLFPRGWTCRGMKPKLMRGAIHPFNPRYGLLRWCLINDTHIFAFRDSRFSQWCCWNWSFLGFYLRVDIPEDLILHLYLHHARRGGCHEVGCVLVERKYETYPSLRKFREMEPGMKVLTNLGSPVALAWDDYSQLLFRGESEERALRSEILNGGFAPGRSDGFLCTVHYKLQGCRN